MNKNVYTINERTYKKKREDKQIHVLTEAACSMLP